MACVLYKEGNSHKEFGVPCEIVRVDPAAVQRHLDVGYVLDPHDLYQPDVVESGEPVETGPGAEDEDVMGNPDSPRSPRYIRRLAKEAGIEGWETARIKTLKAALDNGSSEE